MWWWLELADHAFMLSDAELAIYRRYGAAATLRQATAEEIAKYVTDADPRIGINTSLDDLESAGLFAYSNYAVH